MTAATVKSGAVPQRVLPERALPPRAAPQGTSRGPAFWLGISAVMVALVSGIATSLILTGMTRIRPTDGVFLTVIFVNMLLVLPLVAVIAWQIWRLWHERRHQAAGSRLHIRIVGLFSVIALLPSILLAAFAAVSLNRALDQVFSKQIRNIVTNSQLVANAYIEEHAKIMRGDVLAMARDIDASASLVRSDPVRFKALFTAQAGLRDLAMAYLIEPDGKILLSPDKAVPTISISEKDSSSFSWFFKIFGWSSTTKRRMRSVMAGASAK